MQNTINGNNRFKVEKMINNAFPNELVNDVLQILKLLPFERKTIESDEWLYAGESRITIPARVYFSEPQELEGLTETQMTILCAIMTRHHCGYVRQQWADRLLAFPSPWTTPFLALLLGEYVIEIVEMLGKKVDNRWLPFFQEFATRNPDSIRLINQRIISYWDCYYKHQYPNLCDYPGYQVALRLGLWNGCPRMK